MTRPSPEPWFILSWALVAATAPHMARADTAEEALSAMELPAGSFASVTSAGDLERMVAVRSSLGATLPIEGETMVFLFTGDDSVLPGCIDSDNPPGGAAGDRVEISFDLQVPEDARSLSFDFFFLSREYPFFVDSQFNDSFTAELTSAAWEGNIAFDAEGNPVDVNNVFFEGYISSLMAGSGFDCEGAGGGTRWIRNVAPVAPGEVAHLSFAVEDVTDGILDSGVLLDNFQFSPTAVEEPTIGPADVDGDGEDATEFGGTDCDDSNPAVNSEADEACENGQDDDCDGEVDRDDADCRETVDLDDGVTDPGGCSCGGETPSSLLPVAGLAGILGVGLIRRKIRVC